MVIKENHFDLNFLTNITSTIDEEDDSGDSFFTTFKLVTYFGIVIGLFILVNIFNYVYQMKMYKLSQLVDENLSGLTSSFSSKSYKEATKPPRYSELLISVSKLAEAKSMEVVDRPDDLPTYTTITLQK